VRPLGKGREGLHQPAGHLKRGSPPLDRLLEGQVATCMPEVTVGGETDMRDR